MKTTHFLSVLPHGHGHWLISTDHYGKAICCITTNSIAVDEYKSGENRIEVNRGYKILWSEIINRNNQANWYLNKQFKTITWKIQPQMCLHPTIGLSQKSHKAIVKM